LFVEPSKESGEAPRISEVIVRASVAALPIVVSPFKLAASATVRAPFTVVVTPVFETETEVAFVVPRLSAAAASTVKAPTVVDQIEAAPAVNVRAPPEVKDEAEVGVKFTAPAPVAVKLPEVRVKAIAFPEVVMVAPPLYADWRVGAEVIQVEQVTLPSASSASGAETETAKVPFAFGTLMVFEVPVGSVIAKIV